MNLKELSVEYRKSGEMCKNRLAQLEGVICDNDLTENQRLQVRRQMTMLSAMVRDTIAMSNYLRYYYGRD